MRPLGARLGNVYFLEYTFVFNIYCQQLGNLCIGIGYILHNLGIHVSWRACMCALWLGNVYFLEYTFILDMYWGIYKFINL